MAENGLSLTLGIGWGKSYLCTFVQSDYRILFFKKNWAKPGLFLFIFVLLTIQ